jgi:hypothetical protein
MMKLPETAVQSKSQDHNYQEEEQSCKVDGTMHVLITRTVQITIIRKHEIVDTEL